MNLVVVAGGLGSRLAPLTNYIPKFLVNIGKNTGYVEMIRYWSEQCDLVPEESDAGDFTSLTVIVHPAYENLVRSYHNMYFPKIPLIVKTVGIANGSAHAIMSTCEHLVGEPTLFTWCDVIPKSRIDVEALAFGPNLIFTNKNSSNRYGVVDFGDLGVRVELDENERGGCFGLYFVKTFAQVNFKDGQDFIDVIEQYGPLYEHPVLDIIDFGDMPKLQRVREMSDEAREFNSIDFIDEYVKKTAMNAQGEAIIAREAGWYEELGALCSAGATRPPVPDVWVGTDKKSFMMSRVLGVPIWKAWAKLSAVDRRHVLQQVIQGEQALFDLKKTSIGLDAVLKDVATEAGTKLRDRYLEIKDVIDSFGEIQYVNGFELSNKDPLDTILAIAREIERYYISHQDTMYGFIHGDLQFSNSMVDLNTMKVTIIDPRGYFGKTVGSGLQDYDIGKLLYALSGYDTFNYDKNFGIMSIGGNGIRFAIHEPSHDGIIDIMQSHFKPIHFGWKAVNFLGLAQYIKSDPVKSVCAHYHGLALAEKWLRSMSQ